ncbi:MAG TPA: hypothetical protein VF331_26670 [Polyangiales bacterium]
MSELTFDAVKAAVLEAGFEVLRAKGETIQLAERVRSHLMDAGVSVQVADALQVSVVVRSQRSDFPAASTEEIFHKVRHAVDPVAHAHGFLESSSQSRQLHDPGDSAHVLDVWYELTYTKPCSDLAALVLDLQWALSLPKCVTQ